MDRRAVQSRPSAGPAPAAGPVSRAFETAYADGGVPTWEIGRPQPAIARLVEAGAFGGPGTTILDAGCGTGEHALLLASHGHAVVGIDIAGEAIRRAVAKAAHRAVVDRPVFHVRDALDLEGIGAFDRALDVGLFHTFADDDRRRYAASLASVVRPGGCAFVLCWSDRNPFGFGPRRVARREIRSVFRASAGWRVDRIEGEELVSRLPGGRIHAWLVRLARLG